MARSWAKAMALGATLLLASATAIARKHDHERAKHARHDEGHGERERWRKGQRTAPGRESDDIGQRLHHVDPKQLVSVEGIVAGADAMKHAKGRRPEERFLVSRELKAALIDLRREVKAEYGDDYEIWLNGAYDSSGHAHKGITSLHCTGRAVDLDLYRVGKNGKGGKDSGKVHEFAATVNKVFTAQAGPDGRLLHAWVYDEGNHVHASLESPSLGEDGDVDDGVASADTTDDPAIDEGADDAAAADDATDDTAAADAPAPADPTVVAARAVLAVRAEHAGFTW